MPLPLEVLERIIDLGSSNPDTDRTVYPTLISWSRTSYACMVRSRLNLHQHVVLRSASQMTRFLQSFSERPHLQDMVSKLTIIPEEAAYLSLAPLIRQLTALRVLTVTIDWTKYPPWYARSMSYRSGITRLHLLKCTFHGISDLRATIAGFSHLQELIIDTIRFRGSLSDGQLPLSNSRPIGTPILTPILTPIHTSIRDLRTIRMDVSDLRYSPNPFTDSSSHHDSASIRLCQY